MKNLSELISRISEKLPDKVGIISNDREYTWAEVYEYSNYIAGIIKKNSANNKRIGIYLEHDITQVFSLYSVSLCDSVFVIISSLLKHDQIGHIILDADINYIITTKDKSELVRNMNIPHELEYLCIDEELSKYKNKDEIPRKKIFPSNIPSDVGCIIYTSGSTGHPKGVVVPNKTLTDGARIVSQYLEITKDDNILSILPYSFDYGLNQVLSATYTGACLVIRQFRFPQDILSDIEKYKITGLAGVPSMWWSFFDPRLTKENKNNLDSLRYITTAGGKHSKELLEKLSNIFSKTEIIIMYGLTESFRSTYMKGKDVFKKIGSIGKAVPEVEILVLNDNNEKCMPNERGVLHHRGAFINYGYLNNSELTKERYVQIQLAGDGCIPETVVRSGDIVSYDEDGYIYFHEREDVLIKSYGYRVSPSQIEEYVNTFPDIKQCAVTGIPDEKIGHKIALAYSTYNDEQIDENKLILFLKENLPNYSLPQLTKYFEVIPHLPNGKIDYQTIISSFN